MIPYRTIALVLVLVMLITAATPARAEAIEPLTILAIASAAVVVIILITFLVVANMSDRRQADVPDDRPAVAVTAFVIVAQGAAAEGP
jgi:hypothetical protein